jgi:pyruvate/2-oxoglutarate dehydrogenase complex dihydrolipoamide acyltransferase (E2) component
MSETRIKISARQRFIGDKLKKSVVEYPQPFSVGKIDVGRLLAYKKVLGDRGVETTVGAFFAKAVSLALQKYPRMNARMEGMEMVLYDDVNVGIAMSVADNLMVCVVRETQNKSVAQISAEIRGFRRKMLDNALKNEDLQGGTVTLSSLGKGRTQIVCPIVNNDECLMIGIGTIFPEPIFTPKGQIVRAESVYVTVCSNHYLTNGADISAFIDYMGDVLEKPEAYFNVED